MELVDGCVDLRGRGFAPGMARNLCDVTIEYRDCTEDEIKALELKALDNISALLNSAPMVPHPVLLDSRGLRAIIGEEESYTRIHAIREMAVIAVDRLSPSSCIVTLRATMLEPPQPSF